MYSRGSVLCCTEVVLKLEMGVGRMREGAGGWSEGIEGGGKIGGGDESRGGRGWLGAGLSIQEAPISRPRTGEKSLHDYGKEGRCRTRRKAHNGGIGLPCTWKKGGCHNDDPSTTRKTGKRASKRRKILCKGGGVGKGGKKGGGTITSRTKETHSI